MRKVLRVILASAFAVSLAGLAGVSSAEGPAGNVPPHRHFVKMGSRLVPVGPQVCDEASLQFAFNQFHARVHVGTAGTFAMDHPHNQTDITAGPC